MSKWIDADALIAYLKEYNPQTSKIKMMQIVTNNRPSIDIVRCKECVEYDGDDWCMYWENVINPDDFCSYGEREGE